MNKLRILVAFLLLHTMSIAQQKTVKPASTKLPLLSTTWAGELSGNISVERLKQVIDSPLVVVDEKGNRYAIKGFRINYTFTGSYKDEETGLTKTMKDFRAFDFENTNRLSDLWVESIGDNAKSGDKILINKVLAKMKNGKSMLARDLTITVQ